MNILEHRIGTIFSEMPSNKEWTKKYESDFVDVHFLCNVCGSVDEKVMTLKKAEWEEIKTKGYFMA